jgi:hypothetical protein
MLQSSIAHILLQPLAVLLNAALGHYRKSGNLGLTDLILEVRVCGRGFQVRVSYLLWQQVSRHTVSLEHGDAAETELFFLTSFS